MNSLDLTELFNLQHELDLEIQKHHNVSYKETRDKRSLALLVELGELANETRCFKFWSFKPASSKEIVLDEYSDGMHFFISLGIDIDIKDRTFYFDDYEGDLSKGFLEVYSLASIFFKTRKENDYLKAFTLFLSLYKILGFEINDIILGYKKKCEVNHVRQKDNY